jgi:spore coat protein CotH
MLPAGEHVGATFRRLAAVGIAAAGLTAFSLLSLACGSPAGSGLSTTTVTAATATTATTSAPASTATTAAPVTSTVSTATTAASGAGTAGSTLFDSTKVHTITVSFVQADYDAMIEAYKTSDAKNWIEATITIDGVSYQRVGMRLKGNSSLRGLANGRGQGPGGTVSATDPQGLPWLIRLDKNIKGQDCDGITDLVVRSNNTQTALNEAVSLKLLEMAGLASERAIPVSFTVNGGAAKLRLVTELPNDTWMQQHFSASGALYKAEASGDYSYRGSDPASYTDVFDQEAGKKNTDLAPLIKFLDFVNNSDDATFAATLGDKLDVEAFAKYLAMEDLIGNFDDIDGPGNNSYLYWDPATGRFTIVPWDHNLAFGALGGGAGGAAPGGAAPGGGFPGGKGPRGKVNRLVTRFRAETDFQALYQKALTDLKQELYASGSAAKVLDGWIDVLKAQASGLVSASTIDTEAAKISGYFVAN